MHPRKEAYSREVLRLVTRLCGEMTVKKNQAIPLVLDISESEAEDIINKIMIALPDKFFYNATIEMLDDMLLFISKNILLFQVQENIEEERYAAHLIGFIRCLVASIADRYYQQ